MSTNQMNVLRTYVTIINIIVIYFSQNFIWKGMHEKSMKLTTMSR